MFLAFAAPTACGSSDNTSATVDAGPDGEVIPDPDTVPPQVVFRTPTDGEAKVALRKPIRATFSETVKFGPRPATLRADGVEIPCTFTLSDNGTVMTITPTAEPPVPATLSVEFGDVTDLRGNPLVRPPWTWSVPRWLEIGNSFPSGGLYPMLAAGPGEYVHVAALFDEPARTFRLYQTSTPTTSWRALADSRNPTPNATIAVDADGSIVAAFASESGESVSVARYTTSIWKTIGGPFPLAINGSFSLAFDKRGTLILAYDAAAGDGAANVIVQALEPLGEPWQWSQLRNSVNDPSTEKAAYFQSLTLNSEGIPYVSYRTERPVAGEEGTILEGHVRAWTQGQWQPIGDSVSAPDEDVRSLMVAVDATSSPFAIAQLSNRFLPKAQMRILRLENSKWTLVGPELEGRNNSMFFGRMRDGHLFAYVSVDGDLRTLDVAREGWTRIPLDAVGPFNGAAGTLDPTGIPLIAWITEPGNLSVLRWNR
ncbi:Ig-like domain-containing protein [Pendulispora rubella]|uniref:Ig-like domain-containing protein n=1 Tax=Pendulispora rubella TaxID=2741070 RepID=A0ABZ2L007_9BACT